MARLISSLVILLLSAAGPCLAVDVVRIPAVAAGCAESIVATDTSGAALSVGRYNSQDVYVGFRIDASTTVCQVDVYVGSITGTPTSAHTYAVQVYSLSGTNLATLQTTLATFTGADVAAAGAGAWLQFQISPTGVSGGMAVVVEKTSAVDSVNYWTWDRSTSDQSADIYATWQWNSSKVNQLGGQTAPDFAVKIYAQ